MHFHNHKNNYYWNCSRKKKISKTKLTIIIINSLHCLLIKETSTVVIISSLSCVSLIPLFLL